MQASPNAAHGFIQPTGIHKPLYATAAYVYLPIHLPLAEPCVTNHSANLSPKSCPVLPPPQVDTSQRDEEKQRHEIAFAEVAFTENARAIMADCDLGGEGGGGSCSGGSGSGGAEWGGGGGASGRDWDRRLVRSNNFLQLCRDDLCGKMKTLKVRLFSRVDRAERASAAVKESERREGTIVLIVACFVLL